MKSMKLSLRTLWLAGLAAMMVSSALAQQPVAREGVSARGQIAPPEAVTYDQHVAADDVVLRGIVQGARETRRRYAETCGTTGLMPYPVTEIKLAVTAVWAGTVADSVVEVSILEQGFGQLVGREVLVSAYRSCDDGWRLRGRLVFVDQQGGAHDRAGCPRAGRMTSPRSATVSQMETSVITSHPTKLFDGVTAVGLARRVDRGGWTPTGITFQLESLGWVVGRADRLPRYMHVPLAANCFPEIFTGDSLLVPVPGSFVGDTLQLDRCASSLKIKSSFVPALAQRLTKVATVFDRRDGTYDVRPYHGR